MNAELKLLNRKGQAVGVRALPGLLVSLGVLLMVGLFVFTKIKTSITTTGFSAAESTAFNNTVQNVVDGFDLASILVIVLAAAAIIGVLTAAFI